MDKENYNRKYMEEMIETYDGIPECSCRDCDECDFEQLEECYGFAQSNCNSQYATSIDYGGYDSEEEFWENL